MLPFKSYKIKRIKKKIKAYQHGRKHNQPGKETIKKEIKLYFSLANIYLSLHGKKKYPHAHLLAQECYRQAAMLESAEAQFLLAQMLFEEAKIRDSLQKEDILASTLNEKKAISLYEEAHAYMLAAENQKHIEAKRLHGLSLIYGWGVNQDKQQGFELIVASIEQENSWDKLPQICDKMGLKKPEFFAQLTKLRNR